MTEPFWVRVGERAGYALAVVVLGPYAAAVRHERRTLRNAFNAWLDDTGAERLVPRAKGTSRRSGSLRGASPLPFEAELDPFEKRARVDVAMTLGRDVAVEMSKLGDRVLVGSTNLDADMAHELAREVAASKLGLETFTLDLRKDRVVIELPAPREAASWKAIEKALVVLVESWSRRWTSYR